MTLKEKDYEKYTRGRQEANNMCFAGLKMITTLNYTLHEF